MGSWNAEVGRQRTDFRRQMSDEFEEMKEGEKFRRWEGEIKTGQMPEKLLLVIGYFT